MVAQITRRLTMAQSKSKIPFNMIASIGQISQFLSTCPTNLLCLPPPSLSCNTRHFRTLYYRSLVSMLLMGSCHGFLCYDPNTNTLSMRRQVSNRATVWPCHRSSNMIVARSASARTTMTMAAICSQTRELLLDEIRLAYEEGETDGILDLAKKQVVLPITTATNGTDEATADDISSSTSTPRDDTKLIDLIENDAEQLISLSLEAVHFNKAQASGIINAWIGSCCLVDDPIQGAKRAERLLQAYDNLQVLSKDGDQTRQPLVPDMVTLSLTYTALSRVAVTTVENSDKLCRELYLQLAESILDRAIRMSKKQTGSKRRKALAATRRKGPTKTCHVAKDELQTLLGHEFDVLDETDDYVVVNKPSGVPCYHKHKTTSGKITAGRKRDKSTQTRKKKKKSQPVTGNNRDALSAVVMNDRIGDISLEDALLHCNVPLSTLNPDGVGVVHRLDRGTSGCMILAKSNTMHAKLVAEFFLRRTTKKYMAVVSPAPPEHSMVDKNEQEDTVEINIPVQGRPARSKYRVIKRLHYNPMQPTNSGNGVEGIADNNDAAIIEVELLTGRKHQIRVHCAQGLGCPVINDPLYGTDISIDEAQEGKHWTGLLGNTTHKAQLFLHAFHLSVPEYGIMVEKQPPWLNAVGAN